MESIDLFDLKPGDKITHYCFGEIVEGTIIEMNKHGALSKHEAVRWGNDKLTETLITPSDYLQRKWGGKDLTPGAETTPKAWYNGQPIKSKLID